MSVHNRITVGALGTAFLLLAAVDARSREETEAGAWSWQAPVGCPQADAVRRRVVAQAGGWPEHARDLSVVGVVEQPTKKSWRARLNTRLGGNTGERTLNGASCAEVSEAAALVVAMMIAPALQAEAAQRRRATSKRPAPAELAPGGTPIAAGAQPRSAKSPPGETAPALTLRTGGLLSYGALPGRGAGLSISGGYLRPPLSIELRLASWLPTTAWSDSQPGAGGRFSMQDLSVGLCLRSRWAPLRWDSCAGYRATRMTGDGFGVTAPASSSASWSGLYAEQALALELAPHWGLRLATELGLPAGRPRFVIANLGTVHRPASASLSVGLSSEVTF